MKELRSSYWTFLANPTVYDIERAVLEKSRDYWTVQGHDVRAGDRVIIWKAQGRSQKRGIIALGEVLTDPKPCIDPNPDYWINQNKSREVIDRVEVRYLIPSRLPLWLEETSPAVIRQLKAANATGGSVFHVTPDEWNAVMQVIGGWPAPEIEDAELAVADIAGKSTSGQGFRIDVTIRRAIEQYAMQEAIAYYEEQGWTVKNVSDRYPYDLLCESHGEILHVEVKGTTSDGSQVILTRNEVEHARNYYPGVALFVLAQIQIEQGSTKDPRGGVKHILDPWNVDEGTRSPLAFMYTLPDKDGVA